ncbi:hypothetical protein SAMN05216389_103201 [Oceanobacillus limi]|uniref:Uncharacterized protein n=1 Tax=Oceanobacillus limi TaxID=930131 RepID=A0A1I0ADS9_9BACI|nr:hypothetical protein [Oceanobacillus limi]SES92357.1 hypothetical protein SAMN05216389_103201 [Oceanobacillus limi]
MERNKSFAGIGMSYLIATRLMQKEVMSVVNQPITGIGAQELNRSNSIFIIGWIGLYHPFKNNYFSNLDYASGNQKFRVRFLRSAQTSLRIFSVKKMLKKPPPRKNHA